MAQSEAIDATLSTALSLPCISIADVCSNAVTKRCRARAFLYGVTAEDPVLAFGSEDAHDHIDVTALFGIGQSLTASSGDLSASTRL